MISTGRTVTVCFLLLVSLSLAQRILQHPVNTIMFQDWTATFTCEVSHGFTNWAVNGKPRGDLSPQLQRDVHTSSETESRNPQYTLAIKARAEYNGTTVQCYVFSLINGGFSDQSDIVSLIIQGPVSKVVDIRVRSKSSSVTVSWTPPFSLDVTDVDPDVWYSLLIYNMTDENSTTDNLCTDCMDINETYYTFTHEYFSHSHVYNITVIPWNGVGEGESSTIIFEGIKFKRETISVRNDNKCNILFNVIGDLRMVNNITFDYGDGRQTRNISSHEDRKVTFSLPVNKKFFTSFHVDLEFGEMENISSDYFTTHDVQSVATVADSSDCNNVDLTVEFIENTRARGCFVIFYDKSGFAKVFRAVSFPEVATHATATIDNILPLEYRVIVYDLEQDGLPTGSPAYEQDYPVSVFGDTTMCNAKSKFIRNATVDWGELNVRMVSCEFKDGIEGASCVLVYQEYGSKTLEVAEYPQNSVFPVALTVDPNKLYTFAVFGKNGSDIDYSPTLTAQLQLQVWPTLPTPLPSATDIKEETKEEDKETCYSQMHVVAISIGSMLLGCVLASTAATVACLVVGLCRKHKSHAHEGDVLTTRNAAVYDEVVLPLSTSSSAIPTEPNAAYVSSTRTSH